MLASAGYRVVEVAELPSFHNAFKCTLSDRFDAPVARAVRDAAEEIADRDYPPISDLPRRHPWQLWRPTPAKIAAAEHERAQVRDARVEQLIADGREIRADYPLGFGPLLVSNERAQEISRAVRASLTPAECAACRYHQPDWPKLTEIACELVLTHAEHVTWGHVYDAAEPLDAAEARWLKSLFTFPIKWSPGELDLTNGQHRVCGISVSGAKRVPVSPRNPIRSSARTSQRAERSRSQRRSSNGQA